MSYVVSHDHIVFGTKQRRSTIVSVKLKDWVSYIGGICRNNKMILLEKFSVGPSGLLFGAISKDNPLLALTDQATRLRLFEPGLVM